jgi:hypothetical protein
MRQRNCSLAAGIGRRRRPLREGGGHLWAPEMHPRTGAEFRPLLDEIRVGLRAGSHAKCPRNPSPEEGLRFKRQWDGAPHTLQGTAAVGSRGGNYVTSREKCCRRPWPRRDIFGRLGMDWPPRIVALRLCPHGALETGASNLLAHALRPPIARTQAMTDLRPMLQSSRQSS